MVRPLLDNRSSNHRNHHFRLHFAFISVGILRSFCRGHTARSLTKKVHLCTHLLTVCLETLLLREENQRIPLTTGTYVLKHHLNFQKNQSRPCQVLSTFCQRRFRNLRKFTKIYENLRKFTKIYEKKENENACDFKIQMF